MVDYPRYLAKPAPNIYKTKRNKINVFLLTNARPHLLLIVMYIIKKYVKDSNELLSDKSSFLKMAEEKYN